MSISHNSLESSHIMAVGTRRGVQGRRKKSPEHWPNKCWWCVYGVFLPSLEASTPTIRMLPVGARELEQERWKCNSVHYPTKIFHFSHHLCWSPGDRQSMPACTCRDDGSHCLLTQIPYGSLCVIRFLPYLSPEAALITPPSPRQSCQHMPGASSVGLGLETTARACFNYLEPASLLRLTAWHQTKRPLFIVQLVIQVAPAVTYNNPEHWPFSGCLDVQVPQSCDPTKPTHSYLRYPILVVFSSSITHDPLS